MPVRRKFGVIAPSYEIANIAFKVADELKEEIDIQISLSESALECAKRLKNSGVDVLLARGPSLSRIREFTQLPVVSYDPGVLDLIKALKEAVKLGNRIGLVSFYDISFDLSILEELLGIKIIIFPRIIGIPDLKRQIEKAKELGLDVLVGGYTSTRVALQMGIHGITIFTGSEEMRQAFYQAREIAQHLENENKRNEQLKALLALTDEGVISSDKDGNINFANPPAEKLCQRKLVGIKIKELIPELSIENRDCMKKITGKMMEINGHSLIVNYIPICAEEVFLGALVTMQDPKKIRQLERNIQRHIYHQGLVAKFRLDDLYYQSPQMEQLITTANSFAKTNFTVLIIGETGTGKEMLAQGIHSASMQHKGPFVALNCAGLPDSLLESELFGYDEGAFTGAKRGGKPGLLELAQEGTVFLDEISETTPAFQAKLLRVLEQREMMPLGSNRVIPLDVRIIAASNKYLEETVAQGNFRHDLYYRLNSLRLEIPPLRKRCEDIVFLIDMFLKELGEENRIISNDILNKLTHYYWPGNVRELKSFIESIVVLCQGKSRTEATEIQKDMIRNLENRQKILTSNGLGGDQLEIRLELNTLANMEQQLIQKVLKRTNFNKTEAANILGLSRQALYKRLHKTLEEI